MENIIRKNQANKQMGWGILVIAIGGVLLLRNSGIDVPHWILSWHTVMLGAGLWIGYTKDFRGSSWLALTLIGGIFTIKDITILDFELSRITTAIAIISLGLWVIFRPQRVKHFDAGIQNTSTEIQEMKN